VFLKNEIPMTQFSQTTKDMWSKPATTEISIPLRGPAATFHHHGEFRQRHPGWLTAARPAVEGIHSVELANAMLYSALKSKTVELPLNAKAFEQTLQGLIRISLQKENNPTGRSQRFQQNHLPNENQSSAVQTYTVRITSRPGRHRGHTQEGARHRLPSHPSQRDGTISEADLAALCRDNGLTLCATHEPGIKISTNRRPSSRASKLGTKITAFPRPVH